MSKDNDVCTGDVGGCKIFLNWSDVKEICTDAVSEAYEQVRVENYGIKKENEELSFQLKNRLEEVENMKKQINEANCLIKWVRHSSWSPNQEEDDFDRYCKKWGVK